MEVFTIDLSLNLMLTLVVLIHVTIRSSESTDSSILICCTQIPPVYDSKIPLKPFRPSTTVDIVCSNLSPLVLVYGSSF